MIANSEKTLIETKVRAYSFRCAYDRLPKNKMKEVRRNLKHLLNVRSEKAIYDRISGRTEPKMREAREIENIFTQYGITINWGEIYENSSADQ